MVVSSHEANEEICPTSTCQSPEKHLGEEILCFDCLLFHASWRQSDHAVCVSVQAAQTGTAPLTPRISAEDIVGFLVLVGFLFGFVFFM